MEEFLDVIGLVMLCRRFRDHAVQNPDKRKEADNSKYRHTWIELAFRAQVSSHQFTGFLLCPEKTENKHLHGDHCDGHWPAKLGDKGGRHYQ